MNVLDVAIVALAVMAGVGGHRLGFAARMLSWLGMAVGLVVTARLLPTLVGPLDGPDPTGRFLVATGVLLGGSAAGLALGLAAGSRIHPALPSGGRPVDRVLGAVAGVVGVLATVWLLAPVMGDVPGTLSGLSRGSGLARMVAAATPRPPDTLQTLRRLVGDGGFPQVFDGDPSLAVHPPPADSGLPSHVTDAVRRSTVRIEARACGRIQEGSGFVAEPGLVVTNAHVVAGADRGRIDVFGPGDSRLTGEVVLFDPDRDLALLQVALDAVPLPLGDAGTGATGAVFGHPAGGPLRLAPFGVSEEIRARGRDLYGHRHTERLVLVLASHLAPGDSGAGLVDPAGRVVGVAFAIAPDDPRTAYALDVAELQAVLGQPRAEADTGRCLQ